MKPFDIGKVSQKILLGLHIETSFENECPSTNRSAKEQAPGVEAPLKVYLTNHQTAGRGRNLNVWSNSSPGTSFLSSWSFSFSRNPQPILSPLVGLAIYTNLTECFSGLNFSLKAPNDILLGGEKLCGILVENILIGNQGRCIIGIGLNVFDAPKNLRATSLIQHTLITERDWQKFLTSLHFDLIECMLAAESNRLETQTCQQLAEALRRNPSLQDELLEVTPDGSLVFKSKKLDWQSL